MAVKIKMDITPSTQYIEDPINIKLGGGIVNYDLSTLHFEISVMSGNSGQIAYYQEGIVSTNFNITCPSGTHQSPSGVNYGLEYIYSSNLWKNTDKLTVVFSLIQGDWQMLTVKKTLYIKPDLPTFNNRPTYRVINSTSNTFSGDNQMIVRGLSNITFANITGTAKKHATLKYFRMNDKLVDYNTIINLPSGWYYPIEAIGGYTNLEVALIDSRGFEKVIQLADFTKYTYSYQIPKITEMTVERDIASETTTLNVKGYYSEGYQVNKNALTSGYEYAENVEGATTETGITSLTITKTPTSAFQDYLNILEEYNNPHYIIQPGNVGLQYYPKATFEDDIQSLFETAIRYNTKYTQEYLEEDFASSTQRYYCLSGGYSTNGSWKTFWQDTLKEIYKVIYDNNVYGVDIVGDEDGGNYQFEINATIQGDMVGGFSIDKTFNITSWILDSKKANTSDKRLERTEFLPTAIPSIDVYKDKVALHGLFDENISDSDIQLWGNVYLNGSKINAGVLQMVQTANLDTLSTNYNYFPLFYSNSEIDVPVSTTDKLVLDHKTINYGDRTNSTVYGVTIGSGVELIRVNFSVRYLNNHTANQAISTSIFVYKNNSSSVVYGCSTTAGANNRLTETGNYYLEVEEGDFVFLVGWRITKTADVDVISSNNATNMSVEIIN